MQLPARSNSRPIISAANLLDSRNGRLLTFGTLYVSEGIAYGFSATAMVTFMRLQGLSLEQIGAFAAAQMLPWGFKWAWAPLIDIIKLRRFGGRKAWLMLCTSMMTVTLVVMALVDFESNYQALLWMVLLNNLFCATQDVAIDSLAVSTLKEDERGTGNGFMFGGQYLGIALGGGGTIYVSSLLGFNSALLFAGSLLLVLFLFIVFFVRDPAATALLDQRQKAQLIFILGMLRAFLSELYRGFLRSGRGPAVGLIFAILPVGAIALGYAILGSLQVDIGLDQASIAQISILNTIAGALGCVCGGMLGDRLGMKRIMASFYALTALPTLYLASRIAVLGLAAVSVEEFYAVVIAHGFLYGAAFALHSAIFMGMTNPAVAATQFTGYMAISNLAISIGNFWQGFVAERIGYATVLYLDSALVILALIVIPFLANRDPGASPKIDKDGASLSG